MSSGATRLKDTLHAASQLLATLGRSARRHWNIAALVIVVAVLVAAPWLIAVWALPALGRAAPWIGALISAALAIMLALGVICALLAALLWLLWRPRVAWLRPADASDNSTLSPETLAAAREVVAQLRGSADSAGRDGRLLLVAATGAGKRSLACQISAAAGAPLASLSATGFGAAPGGVDALAIRRLYRRARRQANRYGACVLYLDDLDALSRARGAEALGALLAELDPPPTSAGWGQRILRALGLRAGGEARSPVLTIGATSDPAALPPALTRAGRLDCAITLAPRALTQAERRRLAYHEAGRAVALALLAPDAQAARASLLRGAWEQPLGDEAPRSADEARASIEVALAGRAAEELFLRERLTDASGDLATATRLALGYVARWGMGETLIAMDVLAPTERLAADPAQREQVERLLRQALADARALLEHQRRAVVAVAEALEERGALTGDEIARLVQSAEAPTPTEMVALASLAETALFGASAPVDFEPPAERMIGPVAPGSAAHADDAPPTPPQVAPAADNAALTPTTFAASPSQELRATRTARAIDRAILRAPRQRPSQPVATNGAATPTEPDDGAQG